MDSKENDNSDVSAEFLHNVQTAVDSTGVGGRVGVIDTEQGPLTVIFMDESDAAADTVSSSGDTTIQYVVDSSDASAMQYLADNGDTSTTIQYVTDTAGNNMSNVQYIQDESGQIIQYVTDSTVLPEQSTTKDTVNDGATEVITYLVDEAGNIIQYVTGDASTSAQPAASDASNDVQYQVAETSLETQNVAAVASTDAHYPVTVTTTATQNETSVAIIDAQNVAAGVNIDEQNVSIVPTTGQSISSVAGPDPETVSGVASVDMLDISSGISADNPSVSVTVQTNPFADDDTLTAVPYNPNHTLGTSTYDITGTAVSSQVQKSTLDSLVGVNPIINLQPSNPRASQTSQRTDPSKKFTSILYKQQPSPKVQSSTSILKVKPTILPAATPTTALASSIRTMQPTSLLASKPQPRNQSSKWSSSITTSKSVAKSNVVNISQGVSKIMPATVGTQSSTRVWPRKVDQPKPIIPKVQIVTSPPKPARTLHVNAQNQFVRGKTPQFTNVSNVKNIVIGSTPPTSTIKQTPSISKILIPKGVKSRAQIESVATVTEEPLVAATGLNLVASIATSLQEANSPSPAGFVKPGGFSAITTNEPTAIQTLTGEVASVPFPAGNNNRDEFTTETIEAAKLLKAAIDENVPPDENLEHVSLSTQTDDPVQPAEQSDLPSEPGDQVHSKDDDIDAIPPEGMEAYAPIIELPFMCKECSLEFSSEKLLRKHLLDTYTKRYSCNVCDENLRSKFRLMRHIVDRHTVGMPYKCPNCSSSYNTAAAFWKHAMLHAKLISCEVCSKTFGSRSEVNQHKLTVHGVDRDHICAFCGMIFPDRESYKDHRLKAHGVTRDSNPENQGSLQTEAHAGNITPGSAEDPVTTADKVAMPGDLVGETMVAVKPVVATTGTDGNADNNNSEAGEKVVLAQQSQHIKLPAGMGDKGELTIQLFGDGTMMTSDGSTIDYGNLDLSSLGIDPDMLQDNTDIELIIVQGDGDDIKQQLENDPSKLPTVLENNQTRTVTVKNTPVKFKTGKFRGSKHSKYVTTGTGPRPYSCKQCPRTFRYYRHLRCHEMAHTSSNSISCPLCQRCFVRQANLEAHLELHNKKGGHMEIKTKHTNKQAELARIGNKEHVCEVCTKSYATVQQLKRHTDEVHHKTNMMACPICGKMLRCESSVQRHLKIHIGPFSCHDCKTKFTSRDEFLNHQVNIHPRRSYACRICSKQFTSKMHLWNHMRRAHVKSTAAGNKQTYSCEECGRKFSDKRGLNKHMIIHSGIRNYKCNQCNKAFHNNWRLNNHVKNVHTKQLNYKCNDCGRAFKTNNGFKHHQKSWHSGPYSCSTCSVQFAHKQELLDHQFDAHGLNRYECSVCKMIFRNKEMLNVHHTEEHVICEHLCDICGECFPTKTKLKTHLTDEHFDGDQDKMLLAYPDMSTEQFKAPSRPYSCDICGKSFSYKVPFKAHLKSAHFDGDETALIESYPALLRVPDPPEPSICDYCGKRFTKPSSLNLHLRVHGVVVKKEKIREELIPSSDEEPDLRNIEPRDKKSEYSCDICGRCFSRHASLKKHVTIHLETNETEEAMKKVEWEEHERAEEEEQMERDGTLVIKGATKEYICLICKKKYKRRSELDKHHISQHATGKVKSEGKKERKFKTDSKPQLPQGNECQTGSTALKSQATEKSAIVCKKCNKVFAKRYGLNRHMQNVHKAVVKAEKPGSDDSSNNINQFLGMNFNLEAKREHRKFDIEAVKSKKHKCKQCGESFSRDATLKKHLRSHDEPSNALKGKTAKEETYKCLYCNNKYASALGRAKHIQIMHPGKRTPRVAQFQPSKSLPAPKPKETRLSTSGRIITKKSVDDVALQCDICSKFFTSDIYLQRHIELKHGVKKSKRNIESQNKEKLLIGEKSEFDTYTCDECSKSFSALRNLRLHMIMKHKVKKSYETLISREHKNKVKNKTDETPDETLKTCQKTADMDGNKNIYRCKLCQQKSYSDVVNLRRHMIMKHQLKISYQVLLTQNQSEDSSLKQSDKNIDMHHCNLCDKTFRNQRNLKQHISVSHNENDHPSEKQPKRASQTAFNNDGIKQEFKCDICSKLCTNTVGLRHHMIMKHKVKTSDQNINIHCCKICEKNFRSTSSLQQHMSMKHKHDDHPDGPSKKKRKMVSTKKNIQIKQEVLECDVCHNEFISQKTLDIHMRKHTGETPFSCSLCDQTFISKFKLECHYKSLHANKYNKMMKCKTCLSLFSSEKALSKHKGSHKKAETFECRFCKTVFTDMDKHDEHVQVHTERPYKCEQCDKAFRWKRNLASHIRLFHNGSESLPSDAFNTDKRPDVKMFICKKCGKKFVNEKMLQTHIDIAHKVKQAAVKLARKPYGVKQLKSKSPEEGSRISRKLLTCNICHKYFHTQEKLVKHMISHTSLEQFKCETCQSIYRHKRSLISHQKVHAQLKETVQSKDLNNRKVNMKTTSTTSTCDNCGKTFDKKLKLLKHIQAMHKQTSSGQALGRNVKSSLATELVKKNSKKPYLKISMKHSCKECKLNFAQRCNYRRHMNKVHGEKVETSIKERASNIGKKCQICSATFTKPSHLKRHVLNVHKYGLAELPEFNKNSVTESSSNFHCYYCSDCCKVHWSESSYMLHLKEMHPDRDKEINEQILEPLTVTEIKKEMDFKTEMDMKREMDIKKEFIEAETLTFEHPSPRKRRTPNLGPVRHKCEYCNRVHWTEKSFKAHMLKFHADREINNPWVDGDSAYINTYPTIEIVNDDHEHFEFEGISPDAPSNIKQLSIAPVVVLQRLSHSVIGDNISVDSITHYETESVGNECHEDVNSLNKDASTDDFQETGSSSIVVHESMEVDSQNIVDSSTSISHIDKDQLSLKTETESIEPEATEDIERQRTIPQTMDLTSLESLTDANDKQTADVHHPIVEEIDNDRDNSHLGNDTNLPQNLDHEVDSGELVMLHNVTVGGCLNENVCESLKESSEAVGVCRIEATSTVDKGDENVLTPNLLQSECVKDSELDIDQQNKVHTKNVDDHIFETNIESNVEHSAEIHVVSGAESTKHAVGEDSEHAIDAYTVENQQFEMNNVIQEPVAQIHEVNELNIAKTDLEDSSELKVTQTGIVPENINGVAHDSSNAAESQTYVEEGRVAENKTTVDTNADEQNADVLGAVEDALSKIDSNNGNFHTENYSQFLEVSPKVFDSIDDNPESVENFTEGCPTIISNFDKIDADAAQLQSDSQEIVPTVETVPTIDTNADLYSGDNFAKYNEDI